MIRSLLLFALLLAGLPLYGQDYTPARTEYGLPDLRGTWNFSNPTPYFRPGSFGEREFLNESEIAQRIEQAQTSTAAAEQREVGLGQRLLANRNANSAGSVNNFWGERDALRVNPRTSVIIYPRNGQLPPVQEGVTVQRGDADGVREIPGQRPVRYTHGGIDRTGPEDRGLSERCLVFNNGPPFFSGPYNNNLQIFQNRDHVVILTEMGFDARIVSLDNRPHAPAAVTSWSGDSRGYFDGSTLVVETRNFTAQIASLGFRDVAYGSGENRVLTERFIPTGPASMDYEFTVEDPTTFKDKIVGLIPMSRFDGQLFEYACHAGNYAIRNILKGARQEEVLR